MQQVPSLKRYNKISSRSRQDATKPSGRNEISFQKIQQCPLKNMLKKCADCWCFETIKKIPELAIWHFKENVLCGFFYNPSQNQGCSITKTWYCTIMDERLSSATTCPDQLAAATAELCPACDTRDLQLLGRKWRTWQLGCESFLMWENVERSTLFI